MPMGRKSFLAAVLLMIALPLIPGGVGSAAKNPYLMTISGNGRVLHTPTLHAIFWGSEWNDPSFADDVISGLDTLLAGYSGSPYASTLAEYYDRTGSITPYTVPTGYAIDTSPAPPAGGLTVSSAAAKVCAATGNNPDPNGVYFVFPSTPKAPGSPGSACGFHAASSCGTNKPFQLIGVPYTTGEIGSGCEGGQDFQTGHSLPLGQIANIAIHELAETITDPRNTGWHDSYGEEIGNKCLLTFPSDVTKYPVFTDGTVWKLQGLWSNKAYLAGTGASNRAGQKACVWE
jgi:hypothetical protein